MENQSNNMENQIGDQSENTKGQNSKLILGIGILALILIVILAIVFTGGSNTEEQQQQIENDPEQVIADYISIAYTDSGFIPPVVVSLESKVNFINRSNAPISLVIRGADGVDTYERLDSLEVGQSYMFELPSREYIVTETNRNRTLNLTVK